MLASSSSRYCQDWRSPGQTWIRTPLGWRTDTAAINDGLQRYDTRSEGGGGAGPTAATYGVADFKELLRE